MSTEEQINFQQASTIHKGDYLMINDHPCKCLDVSTSKTGKHGSCKCHFKGSDIFASTVHEIIYSSKENVSVPTIVREEYSLTNISDDGYASLLSVDGVIREDIKIDEDSQIMIDFYDGKSISCSVMTCMGKSVITSHKIEKDN
jgi:translation initiation factor 5A